MSLAPLVRSYGALDTKDVSDSDIPAQIAQGLGSGTIKLIDIVNELKDSLTSEDEAIRSRGDAYSTGVGLLAAVVNVVDPAKLDRQSTLASLTDAPMFGQGEAIEVAKALFSSLDMRSHPQASRHTVFLLLDKLLTRSRSALQRMGKEFLSGYCALAEGEKDPRNLMLSFNMVHIILLEFDIAQNVEELFDITFCYFPITFTPPPDDPYGISSQDLIVALRRCLCATPLFGPLALPLFLDKLQAASEKAKRQTLQALIVSFGVYGGAVCGEWAARFTEALTIEVFHATDGSLQDLSLSALQSLFATLYPDGETPASVVDVDMHMPEVGKIPHADDIEGVAVKVVGSALEELKEPDKSNAKPACRVLSTLLLSSDRLTRYVARTAMPQLLSLFKNPDEVALRPAALACLSDILSGLTIDAVQPSEDSIVPRPKTLHSNGASPLEPFRDDLLSSFTSGSRSAVTRSAALEGLVVLVKIDQFLRSDEVAYCINALNDVLQSPESDDEYESALTGLIDVSKYHPRPIEQSTLPILFNLLPTDADAFEQQDSEHKNDYRRALSSLAELCIDPNLFEILALRLLTRLETIVGHRTGLTQSAAAMTTYQQVALYGHHLLRTLLVVLKIKVEEGHEDVAKYVDKFLSRLLAMFVVPTLSDDGSRDDEGQVVAKDARLLRDAGKVVTVIVQRVSVERQTTLADAANAAFHGGDLKSLLGDYAPPMTSSTPFIPFSNESSEAQQNTITLFSSALIAMRPTTALAATTLVDFLRRSLTRALQSSNEIQLSATLHLLGSSVNKRAEDLGGFLQDDVPRYWQDFVADQTKDTASRIIALRVCAWIAKALVVRSDQRGYDITSRILELFVDEAVARDAAASLGTIADEQDRVLSKANFAVIKFLYKQRYFSFLLPKLIAGHKDAAGDSKLAYLVALSSSLQHIPKQLAVTEMPKLMPLLVTSLDLDDASLRSNVIDTLTVLVKENASDIEHSIPNLALKALQAATCDQHVVTKPAVTLRISALNFLASLPSQVPYVVLHPHKAVILKELGKATDDPRRDVRRAAVDCRSKWFLYSG
ncbi:hypothetical protein OIV83_003622 [Microbotryomycetes sp. JL201]|nr:hypothetical protein OIV83_003622 [Microbotryomycetes sp. JL201]